MSGDAVTAAAALLPCLSAAEVRYERRLGGCHSIPRRSFSRTATSDHLGTALSSNLNTVSHRSSSSNSNLKLERGPGVLFSPSNVTAREAARRAHHDAFGANRGAPWRNPTEGGGLRAAWRGRVWVRVFVVYV